MTYRAFNRELRDDVKALVPLFWRYWLTVNLVDLSGEVEHELPEGTVRLPAIESVLYWYLSEGFKFQLALKDEAVVGFLIYRVCCQHVLEVRGIYVEPGHQGKGLARGLVDSLKDPIKRLVFQTRMTVKPEAVLGHTAGKRQEIARNEELITWEMEWNLCQ